jgi:hypothetical protein
MKETLENLWYEYILDGCAKIDTDEEMDLTKKIVHLHARANALLNEDQQIAVKEYVDAVHDLEALFAKKAFFKGCEFAISFILESGDLKK